MLARASRTRIPRELVDMIIGFLDDPADWKQCALVCHSWTHASHTHLFREFSIIIEDSIVPPIIRLQVVFNESPRLARYVRTLKLLRKRCLYAGMQEQLVSTMLPFFDHIEAFVHIPCIEDEDEPEPAIDPLLHKAISNLRQSSHIICAKLRGLTILEMRGRDSKPFLDSYRLKHIYELALNHTFNKLCNVLQAIPENNHLHSLELHISDPDRDFWEDISSSRLLDELLSSDQFPCLKRVTLRVNNDSYGAAEFKLLYRSLRLTIDEELLDLQFQTGEILHSSQIQEEASRGERCPPSDSSVLIDALRIEDEVAAEEMDDERVKGVDGQEQQHAGEGQERKEEGNGHTGEGQEEQEDTDGNSDTLSEGQLDHEGSEGDDGGGEDDDEDDEDADDDAQTPPRFSAASKGKGKAAPDDLIDAGVSNGGHENSDTQVLDSQFLSSLSNALGPSYQQTADVNYIYISHDGYGGASAEQPAYLATQEYNPNTDPNSHQYASSSQVTLEAFYLQHTPAVENDAPQPYLSQSDPPVPAADTACTQQAPEPPGDALSAADQAQSNYVASGDDRNGYPADSSPLTSISSPESTPRSTVADAHVDDIGVTYPQSGSFIHPPESTFAHCDEPSARHQNASCSGPYPQDMSGYHGYDITGQSLSQCTPGSGSQSDYPSGQSNGSDNMYHSHSRNDYSQPYDHNGNTTGVYQMQPHAAYQDQYMYGDTSGDGHQASTAYRQSAETFYQPHNNAAASSQNAAASYHAPQGQFRSSPQIPKPLHPSNYKRTVEFVENSVFTTVTELVTTSPFWNRQVYFSQSLADVPSAEDQYPQAGGYSGPSTNTYMQ